MVYKRIQVASKISILSGEAKKSFTEMTLPHLSIVVLIRSSTLSVFTTDYYSIFYR